MKKTIDQDGIQIHDEGDLAEAIFRNNILESKIIMNGNKRLSPMPKTENSAMFHQKLRNRFMVSKLKVLFVIGGLLLILVVGCQSQPEQQETTGNGGVGEAASKSSKASDEPATQSSPVSDEPGADPAEKDEDRSKFTLVDEISVNDDVQRNVLFNINTLAYELPGMEEVKVDNITYAYHDDKPLTMDVYYPPGIDKSSKLPAVLFGFGYRMSEEPLRNAHFYTSWGKLVAAAGMIGIAYDTEQPDRDLEAIVTFIRDHADPLSIDADQIGIMSSSANVATVQSYLMQEGRSGIRFAIYYYGLTLTPDRKFTDLFVENCAGRGCLVSELADVTYVDPNMPLFIVKAGKDNKPNLNDGLDHFVEYVREGGAPVTFIEYEDGEHGFDTQQKTEESAQIIAQTVEFMKANFEFASPQTLTPIVLLNGQVFTATGEDPIVDGGVIIEEGLITAVGPVSELTIPNGATQIDVDGRTILPGLIDARSSDLLNRLELSDGRINNVTLAIYLTSTLEAGVTTVRASGWQWAEMQKIAGLRAALAKEGNKVPSIVIAGTSIARTESEAASRYSHQTITVADTQEARQAAENLIDLGADQISVLMSVTQQSALTERESIPPVLSLEQVKAIVEVAHREGIRVSGQAVFPEEATLLLEAGVDDLANWPSSSENMPDDLLDTLTKSGTPVVSGFFIVPPQEGDVRRYLDAGGTIAYGTFAPNSHTLSAVILEFGLMELNGMSHMEMVMAATANAAEAIGMGEELGTLEVGKTADVIVVDGDPLVDLDTLSKVVYVVKNGELVVQPE